MLIKITNFCSMGCSHCMENSTVAGEHMTKETFTKALGLTERLEGMAWDSGIPPIIALSGGECTEHPDILWFIEEVLRRKYYLILITNGMWLDNPELSKSILGSKVHYIQISNDARFYPKKPTTIPKDPRITYVTAIAKLFPLGRFKERHLKSGLPLLGAPQSFNIRSMTRALGDVRLALIKHRTRAMEGRGGMCSPSISSDGTLVAGESNLCFSIGNVDSTADDVTKALTNMTCNRCGLVDGLTQEQKLAIGEARIHVR